MAPRRPHPRRGWPQECCAPVIRSQALNDLYGKPDDPLTPAERRALRIRSEGLNALARSGVFAQPAVTSSDGFDWGDFGIGVAAALGLVFVATGLAVGARASRRPTAEARPS